MWRIVACVAVAFLAGSTVVAQDSGVLVDMEAGVRFDAKEALRAAVARVDRITVTPSDGGFFEVVDGRTVPMRGADDVLWEISGHAAVVGLVDAVEFKTGLAMPCRCYGTHRLHFYSGAYRKFTLSFHHWSRLRGEYGGPWRSDSELTEAGVERMLQWFSDHGFNAFSLGRAKAEAEERDRQRRRDQLAELFPASARSWIPALDINPSWDPEITARAADLAALYPDKSKLLLDCWRAFGIMCDWPDHRRLPLHGEPGSFLLQAAAEASATDFEHAFRGLTAADTTVRRGAFAHLAAVAYKPEALAKWGPKWPVQLAEARFTSDPVTYAADAVSMLTNLNTPSANELLLKIGRSFAPKADSLAKGANEPAREALAPGAEALMVLAKRRVPAARDLLGDKLRAATGAERTVLEIAMACYEERPIIEPRHVLCAVGNGEPAELAWRMLLAHDAEIAASWLVTAAHSPSYKVKSEAKEKLAAMGLQLLQPPVVEVDPYEETLRRRHLDPATEIAKTTEALLKGASAVEEEPLRSRRAWAYLAQGEYAAAIEDLNRLRAQDGYERAFARFCLGDDDDAHRVLYSATRREKEVGPLYRLRGCIEYFHEDFEDAADYFTVASKTRGGISAEVFRHFAMLHLKSKDPSPLGRGLPEPDTHKDDWPNALVHFLLGHIGEREMLAAAERAEAREQRYDLSLAHWVLAELARLRADTGEERRHLDACLAQKAFDAETHALALRRTAVLDEQVRELIP